MYNLLRKKKLNNRLHFFRLKRKNKTQEVRMKILIPQIKIKRRIHSTDWVTTVHWQRIKNPRRIYKN